MTFFCDVINFVFTHVSSVTKLLGRGLVKCDVKTLCRSVFELTTNSENTIDQLRSRERPLTYSAGRRGEVEGLTRRPHGAGWGGKSGTAQGGVAQDPGIREHAQA